MAMQTIKLGGFVDEEVSKLNANFAEIEADYAKAESIPTATSDLTNDSGYITAAAIPTVPTKTSELTNDSGYITEAAVPTKTSELNNDSGYITAAAIPTVPTKTSELTNDSGYITEAAVPTKTSELNNDSGYITAAAIPTVPTKTSELTNDSGYITEAAVPTKTSELTNDSGYITAAAIPTVPTKTSELTNDAGFVKTTDAAFTNKVDKEAGKGLSENNYTTEEKNKLAGLNAPVKVAFTASDFGSAQTDGYVYATKAIASGTPVAVFRSNGSNYERVLANLEVQGSNVVIGASEAFAGYVLCV